MPIRVARRWGWMAVVGAVVAVGAQGAAPRPRAQACGACSCIENRPAHLVSPSGREVPVNARVFVRGAGVSSETVVLRDRASGDVAAGFVPAGPTEADGLWIVPDAVLAPSMEYDVWVGDEAVGWFETGTHTDDVPPVIDEMEIDADDGTLAAVCGPKTGVALRILPAGEEPFSPLLHVEVIAPDGTTAHLVLVGFGREVAFGRWEGDAEHWGGNCLGDSEVSWLDPTVPVDVEVTMFDHAGNASLPTRIAGVTPIPVAEHGCPGPGELPPSTRDRSAGCAVGW